MARKKRSSIPETRTLEHSVKATVEPVHACTSQEAATTTWKRFSLARTFMETAMANLRLMVRRVQSKRRSRLLLVKETISLGDKRFIAVVGVADEQFLVGGAAHSVSLLAKLARAEHEPLEFRNLLERIQPKGTVS